MKPTKAEINKFIIESNRIEDVHEIRAHNDATKAFNYAMTQETMTIKAVKHIHFMLMRRINPRIAGQFRTCAIYIGGKRIDNVDEFQLEDTLEDMNASTVHAVGKLTTEEFEQMTKDDHVRFEAVHPFEDGNGRVGRILYNWHRLKLGLPLHVIHADQYLFGESEQRNYYKWFR